MLGVIQNCHNFHERTHSMLGEGVKCCVMLFKMLFTMHCDFDTGSLKNQHFQSTRLGGERRSQKKSMLCTLLIMLTIMNDPIPHLRYMDHNYISLFSPSLQLHMMSYIMEFVPFVDGKELSSHGLRVAAGLSEA